MGRQSGFEAVPGRRRGARVGWLVVCLVAIAVVEPVAAEASPRSHKAKTHMRAKPKSRSGKHLSARAAARARLEARAKAEADAVAAGKAAVFAFEGDESEPLRREVVRLLRANGMRVQTDLRPTDTAEQFRDMAAALNLAVYVHGRVKDSPGGHAAVRITIRSGVTGRTIAAASFEGQRRELGALVEEGLWRRVRRPLAQACIAARRPRHHNAPMRIEAGTPIEDAPRWSQGG